MIIVGEMVMKKNSGFIATSLLYSFFLIFCAVLLGLVGNFLHNRTLHNNTIDSIKENLSNVGKRTLADVEVGSYINIPVFTNINNVSTKNINWVVSSVNSNDITLVSDNVVMMTSVNKDITFLQDEINRFYNMYTTGSTSKNYITYFTKELITSFEKIDDLLLKKSLLSNNSEYFYYDQSSNSFYLYQYSCDVNNLCSVKKRTKIAQNNSTKYGLRLVISVSKNTPISSGIGVINNPYNVLYYTHEVNDEKSLVLHYDNLNYSGNLGFKTSANYFKDLSGTNMDGTLNSGNFTNNLTSGVTIPATRFINTKLNIYNIINSVDRYTIEFRAKNHLRLASSPNYLTNFIMLNNNASLIVYTTSNSTGLTVNSFNTITLVKNSTNIDIYINGEFLKNTSNLVSVANNILYIGGSSYAEIFKSIRVYNTSLTEEQIIHNYNVDMRWNQ